MNRAEFLRELDAGLSGMSYADKREILADYEEHFRIGMAEGKTEAEISAALGQPRALAKSYRADYLVEQARTDFSAGNVVRAVLAVVSLSLFNLIVVLGPFLGLVGALIGLWAAGAGMVVAGVAVAFGTLFSPVIPFLSVSVDPMVLVGSFLLGVGITCLGLLACIGLWYLTVWFAKGTVKYLQFNLKIVKG